MATRFPGSRFLALVVVAIVIEACWAGPADPSSLSTQSSPTSSSSAMPPSKLAAAADGLCVVIAALPDTIPAERAFVDLAHDALHALAAEPRLDRTLSARVLEAMDRLEQDLGAAAGERVLAADLSVLRTAATDALGALGIDTPGCPS